MKHKNIPSKLPGAVVGKVKSTPLSRLAARLGRVQKLLIALVIIIVLAAAGAGGAYYYFHNKKKPAPPTNGRPLTPISKLKYQPSNFSKSVKNISQLLAAGKQAEAFKATDAAAAKASPAEKQSLYLLVGTNCQLKSDWACVAKFYGQVPQAKLTISQLLGLAQAKENIDQKAEALNLYKHIHDNKAKYYDQLETKDEVEAQVTSAIARLSS